MRASLITDLRFIIGLFFIACGAILILTDLLGASQLVEGIQINLDSGLVMLGFGVFMLLLSFFRR